MTTKEQLKNVCCNVRFLRARHGLSRSAMAKRIRVSLKTLDSLESGVYPDRCGISLLFYIYQSFGISPKENLTTRLEDQEIGM